MVLALLSLLAVLACRPPEVPRGELRAGEPGEAPVLVPIEAASYEARLDKARARLGSAAPPPFLPAVVGDAAAPGLAVDQPGALRGLPAGTVDLLGDPALREVLLGRDEALAHETLRARGVRHLLLHRALRPAVDRDARVLSRLLHRGQLELFQLQRVGQDHMLYRLREGPVEFSPELAGAAATWLRARLAGRPLPALPKVEKGEDAWAFFAVLRGQGRELAVAFARSGSLRGVLEELAGDLEKEHRRRVEILGFPRLARHEASLVLELHRVVERAEVDPRDEASLQALVEPGIDGVYLLTADQKERGFLPGSAAYTRNLVKAEDILREAARQGRMSEKRPWRDPAARLELVRTRSYMDHPEHGVVDLVRGVPPVALADVTLGSVREAILSSGDWWLANMAADGSLNYKFWPAENRFSNEYNHVRHTLATWNLVQAWRIDPQRDPAYLEGARRALGWTNRFLRDEGEMSYYSYGDNQKLGSVVVNLMGMIDLAKATGSREWDELIRRQARFALFMQEPSGTFRGYHVEPGHPYHGQANDIVPGEAALALVMVAEYFDDDAWIATLPAFFQYYEPWFRSRAARRKDQAWPAGIYDNQDRLDLVQFGPWTVMAANAYHARTGDERVGAFGLEVARWMVEAYMYDEERALFPDYVGGYYKMEGELPAMQAFCYAEGTAAAYALARRMERETDRAFFEHRTRQTLRFALLMQYDELDSYPFSRPELLWGGTRYAMNESKVRIDYSYHAQSAMVQWFEEASYDPELPAEVREGPAGRSRPWRRLRTSGRPLPPTYEGAGLPRAAEGGREAEP